MSTKKKLCKEQALGIGKDEGSDLHIEHNDSIDRIERQDEYAVNAGVFIACALDIVDYHLFYDLITKSSARKHSQ